MQDGDTLLAAVVLIIFGTWCLIRGMVKVVAREHKEPDYLVAVAQPMPDYVIWARCDTKGGVSEWKPVLASNDLHVIWTKARIDYPIETYDLLPLPKDYTPEGQLP